MEKYNLRILHILGRRMELKKNVLIMDIEVVGHHSSYIQCICELNNKLNNKVYLLLPEPLENIQGVELYKDENIRKMKSFNGYKKVIKKIKNIIKEKNIDIVHFLSGDIFYRYFGYGLHKTKKTSTICTFHHFQNDFLHKISIKNIFKKINIGICHTISIEKNLNKYGIKNLKRIDYPYFGEIHKYDIKTLRVKYNLDDKPVYLCLGETRYEKGLDIFLEACENIENINLIIAGKEKDISENEIDKIIREKKLNFPVTKLIKFLTEDELNELLYLSSFVVLPYRKCFDGASGPLVEGVMYDKCIIGPNHGSLGDLIQKYHLGYCFKSENIESLHQILLCTQSKVFLRDEQYSEFKNLLSKDRFLLNYQQIYEEELI